MKHSLSQIKFYSAAQRLNCFFKDTKLIYKKYGNRNQAPWLSALDCITTPHFFPTALLSRCTGVAEITGISWEIIGKGKKLEEMSRPMSTRFRSPIHQQPSVRDEPLGKEALMEQPKSCLLPTNTAGKIFILAVASGFLLFSSSSSWKIISAVCFPLPSLFYKYKKTYTPLYTIRYSFSLCFQGSRFQSLMLHAFITWYCKMHGQLLICLHSKLFCRYKHRFCAKKQDSPV